MSADVIIAAIGGTLGGGGIVGVIVKAWVERSNKTDDELSKYRAELRADVARLDERNDRQERRLGRLESKLTYVHSMLLLLLARVAAVRASLDEDHREAHTALDQLEHDMLTMQQQLAEDSAAESLEEAAH